MTNVIAVGLLSAGIALSASAAQSGLAGKWTGADQNDHPVVLELVVNEPKR